MPHELEQKWSLSNHDLTPVSSAMRICVYRDNRSTTGMTAGMWIQTNMWTHVVSEHQRKPSWSGESAGLFGHLGHEGWTTDISQELIQTARLHMATHMHEHTHAHTRLFITATLLKQCSKHSPKIRASTLHSIQIKNTVNIPLPVTVPK